MTTPRAFRLRMIIGVLALLGLLVAVYLSLYELDLSNGIVCPNQGCETVNRSDYVRMFGLPIGVIGVIGYFIILVIDLGWMTRRLLFAQIPVGLVLISLAGFGFLFSLFLTFLEAFKIEAFCTWCLVSAALMTAVFSLSLAAWPEKEPVRPERPKGR